MSIKCKKGTVLTQIHFENNFNLLKCRSSQTPFCTQIMACTFLCSTTNILSCNSSSLLVTAASTDEAQRGGKGGSAVVAPGEHTDLIASPLIGFHLDSSCKSKEQTSTASVGWQFAKNL